MNIFNKINDSLIVDAFKNVFQRDVYLKTMSHKISNAPHALELCEPKMSSVYVGLTGLPSTEEP